MTIRTDRREIRTRPTPELHHAVRRAWRTALEHELTMAELFAGILESGEYAERGAASLVEYARRLGHHGARAIVQARLGQAIRLRPELAERLRSGAIPIENAETIASAVVDPDLRDREDWLDLAEQCELRALREVACLRKEEVRRGTSETLKAMPLLLTDADVRKVERVRRIASKRARRPLTDSQAVLVALDEYLDRHDPERRAGRARVATSGGRAPDTTGQAVRPRDGGRRRHVPSGVELEVRDRAGHCCEVPGCTATTGLELCHRRWWSRGGAHSPHNIVLLCHVHHVLFDAGRISCLGFANCGRPIFRLPDGQVLRPRPTGPPA